MLIGLTNAPTTFQTYINQALAGLVDVSCIVYLDDILRGTLPATRDLGPKRAKRAKGAGPPVSIRTLSAIRNQGVNAVTSHPLIDLRAGRTIELIGSRPEEKYSVTGIKSY